MRALARFIVMLFAYVVALGAATGLFQAIIYGSGSDLLAGFWSEVVRRDQIVANFIILAIIAAVATSLPVLAAVLFAELGGFQSVRYFLTSGLGAAASPWFISIVVSLPETGRSFLTVLLGTAAFACAGLVGGLVYWVIAGRASGNWTSARGSLRATSPAFSSPDPR